MRIITKLDGTYQKTIEQTAYFLNTFKKVLNRRSYYYNTTIATMFHTDSSFRNGFVVHEDAFFDERNDVLSNLESSVETTKNGVMKFIINCNLNNKISHLDCTQQTFDQ